MGLATVVARPVPATGLRHPSRLNGLERRPGRRRPIADGAVP
jgi:hypothetical protein